jgi:hypothetical protein
MPDQVRHDDFETFYELVNFCSNSFKLLGKSADNNKNKNVF